MQQIQEIIIALHPFSIYSLKPVCNVYGMQEAVRRNLPYVYLKKRNKRFGYIYHTVVRLGWYNG